MNKNIYRVCSSQSVFSFTVLSNESQAAFTVTIKSQQGWLWSPLYLAKGGGILISHVCAVLIHGDEKNLF